METTIKTYYTAAELAGLPGLKISERRIRDKAKRDGWNARNRAGVGGGKEYSITSLPQVTRDYLADQTIADPPSNLPAVRKETAIVTAEQIELPDVATLKKWQRDTMDARLYFIRMIEQAAPAIGVKKAIRKIAQASHMDDLKPFIAKANARKGGEDGPRTLSETSLMRWWSAYKKAGHYSVLAPHVKRDEAGALVAEDHNAPAWAPYFLKAYRVPQKTSVPDAIREMKKTMPPEIPVPSVSQCYRFVEKFSRLDIQRGRKSAKELKGQKSYISRDTSKFNPGDICLCDGHSFKAYIAHPMHGRHFHPEVCAVICAVTRVAIGWSAGLAESAQTVADAIRHAVTTHQLKPEGCIPAILYTDGGAGNKAKVNADEVAGLFSRLGTTFKTGIPGNSQGRGRIERPQASIWIRAAKQLPTYTGKDMDGDVRRKVYLQLEKDVRESKQNSGQVESKLLMPWAQFLDFCQETIDQYNRTEHTSLPKIIDRETGRKRHMCPLEMWSQFLAEGWQPTLPEEGELDLLFRPQVQATTRRGLVTVFGNSYHNKDLEHYHGEKVLVGYDIHDASIVWVRDQDERLICTAKFEGNKRDFFAVPVVEQAVENRRSRRLKTAEKRIEEINLEAEGAKATIVPEHIELPKEIEDRTTQILQLVEARKQRKAVGSSWERYEDICDRAKTGDVTEYEMQWKADYDNFTASGRKKGLLAQDEFCTGSFDKAQEVGE